MSNKKGFTLVELMITMAISGILVAAIYSVYTLQQKTHTAQDQVVEMQQNIRAAVLTMVQELRMAGYDPTSSAGATITSANKSSISFQQDLTEDGDVIDANENITYGFSDADHTDGLVDNTAGIAALRRDTGGGLQPIAENIQAIEFQYRDRDNNILTVPVGTPSEIRTITISILARAARQDARFSNDNVYTPASGVAWDLNGDATGNAANDAYRRRLLTTTVQCRNMGL